MKVCVFVFVCTGEQPSEGEQGADKPDQEDEPRTQVGAGERQEEEPGDWVWEEGGWGGCG